MPIADTGRLIVPTRTRVREAIEDAWRRAVDRAELPGTPPVAELPGVEIERPANAEYGDYASNLALKLARPYRLAPRAIAGVLADAFDERSDAPVGRPTVASPGFINMVLTESELRATLDAILESPDDWGRIVTAAPQRVNVEFVSANPTGPLHIGNARGAFVGDLLCRILEAAGNTATREYYFNDFGSQVRLLGASVWAVAQDQPVPDDGYRGSYVSDLAREMPGAVRAEAEAADDPAWPVGRWASERVRAGIETSLERLGVHFDVWTTEGSLHRDGWVERAVERLRVTGHVYERDGAAWFRSTDFGDDKDRVIRRSNGEYTYFGSDIGYVAEKFSRGFDRLIYIWGADHHGTVARVRNAAEAMGYERERVEMLLMAWVRFVRHGREISMSKRAGEFITLDELLAEVGVDAARWFFASRAAS
ncbi:MAG TPA: arginine--tRNA ligase, partial [Candidatus Limnocylindrales bacterium]